jgi:hypothetical protein
MKCPYDSSIKDCQGFTDSCEYCPVVVFRQDKEIDKYNKRITILFLVLFGLVTLIFIIKTIIN